MMRREVRALYNMCSAAKFDYLTLKTPDVLCCEKGIYCVDKGSVVPCLDLK